MRLTLAPGSLPDIPTSGMAASHQTPDNAHSTALVAPHAPFELPRSDSQDDLFALATWLMESEPTGGERVVPSAPEQIAPPFPIASPQAANAPAVWCSDVLDHAFVNGVQMAFPLGGGQAPGFVTGTSVHLTDGGGLLANGQPTRPDIEFFDLHDLVCGSLSPSLYAQQLKRRLSTARPQPGPAHQIPRTGQGSTDAPAVTEENEETERPRKIGRVADSDGGLAKALLEKGLSRKDLGKIQRTPGAAVAMKTLIERWDDLKSHALSNEDIVKIASKKGAAQALSILCEKYLALQQAGFTQEQIVKIGSNDGATQAFATLLEKHLTLQQAGFTQEQIIKVASNSGGARALNTLLEKHRPLQQAGFTTEQIFKVASNEGGARALTTLLEKHITLQQAGCTQEQIVRIARNKGGSKALIMLLKKRHALQQAGFTSEEIIKVACNVGGAQALQAIETHSATLLSHGFGPHEMTQIACMRGSAQTIVALATLPWPGVIDKEQVLSMASKTHGWKNLEEALK